MTELHREWDGAIEEDGANVLLGHSVGVGGGDHDGVLAVLQLEGKIHGQRLHRRPLLQPRHLDAVEHHEHAPHTLAARGEAGEGYALLVHAGLIPGRGDGDLERGGSRGLRCGRDWWRRGSGRGRDRRDRPRAGRDWGPRRTVAEDDAGFLLGLAFCIRDGYQ